MSFHDVNLKNNGAIVIPQFSTICGEVCNSFADIREIFTAGHSGLIIFDIDPMHMQQVTFALPERLAFCLCYTVGSGGRIGMHLSHS